ncbi:uncharacterized protein G2W53_021883 [Senna tora]|uniref:Uncharacterized protein n=1 Tax=Senna tora TaxID=362788 RepID=A0A834TTL0_9FABA|nr:uncharacterized protein G2W53_021883 [Senna tora]
MDRLESTVGVITKVIDAFIGSFDGLQLHVTIPVKPPNQGFSYLSFHTCTSVHFEGLVVPWFQTMQHDHQLFTWSALSKAIEALFSQS